MQPYLEISTDKTGVVTTASAICLQPNRNRSYALFINDSDVVIYLMKGKVAIANRGIRLNASGGSYEINSTNLYKGEVAAIHAGTGNKVLLINEDEAQYL
ncbi:unnamed protein product [marine sediment metagenome]|uniref:Quercetin 2,3-dioxygenase C-terminal cupin domain-containing protein n=1 Tax=marine sediment metagenome TaxID=412755 RepID=X1KLY2_9ZZZZ